MIKAALRLLALAAALGFSGAATAQQNVLRIGLQDDPDVLDVHKANTFVGRIVFAALCDKLIDIDEKLGFVPQLATSWSFSDDGLTVTLKLRPGALFHDGEPIDAAAVKANLDRARTLSDSRRKSELASVGDVVVIDPLTVGLKLKQRDATILAPLTDRAGMMMSPKSFDTNVAAHPVCSGPYKFVERVQNDRIVLERFAQHWRAKDYHFDRVIYRGIPDSTIRLANLRAGDLDLIERLAPNDIAAVKADPKLATDQVPGIGYQGLTINIANGPAADNPLAKDKRLRQAFNLSIDRDAINQVVFEGTHAPTMQPFPPSLWAYDPAIKPSKRDIAAAKRLMKEAGVERLPVEITVANNQQQQQILQMIQAMAGEAGFDVKLKLTDFATLIRDQNAGRFQVSMIGWSGRVDPDGDVHVFWTSKGAQNDGRYANPRVDTVLDEARTLLDRDKRKILYDEAQKIVLEDMPIIYLYTQPWIYGFASTLSGFKPYPDGMVRLDGMSFKP